MNDLGSRTDGSEDVRRLQRKFEEMESEAARLGLTELARIAGIGALAASEAVDGGTVEYRDNA